MRPVSTDGAEAIDPVAGKGKRKRDVAGAPVKSGHIGRPGPGGDSDKDGIADADDLCPGAAEDADGFQDEDGCPDPDNDGDGVSDVDDRCPDDRSKNPDGCSYARLRVEWSRLGKTEHRLQIRTRDPQAPDRELVRDHVELAGNGVRGAEDALDDVARLLFDHSDVGLCIEGHAPPGNADRRSKVQAEAARRRIETAYRKLAGKALPRARIDTAGRGDTRPLPDTGPDDPANRRIELTTMQAPGTCPAQPDRTASE